MTYGMYTTLAARLPIRAISSSINATAADYTSSLRFATSLNGTMAEAMRISGGGHVGIRDHIPRRHLACQRRHSSRIGRITSFLLPRTVEQAEYRRPILPGLTSWIHCALARLVSELRPRMARLEMAPPACPGSVYSASGFINAVKQRLGMVGAAECRIEGAGYSGVSHIGRNEWQARHRRYQRKRRYSSADRKLDVAGSMRVIGSWVQLTGDIAIDSGAGTR